MTIASALGPATHSYAGQVPSGTKECSFRPPDSLDAYDLVPSTKMLGYFQKHRACSRAQLGSRLSNAEMNPDKLFDYLDGKLPPHERAALEERLMSDAELRSELAAARQIHSGMRNTEDLLPTAEQQRGAVLARRVMISFGILVFLNVLFGIYAIAFMNKKTRTTLNTEKNRTELTQSLARTAEVALPPPSIDVEEIRFIAPVSEQNGLANTILDEAKAAGGSATKGLSDEHGILIFAEIPSARLDGFRDSLKKRGGTEPPPPPAAGEKTILQVRIVSAQ